MEILRDVLVLIDRGESKSRVMALAGLSHDMVTRYVGWLLARGHLADTPSGRLAVTERGRALLEDLERVARHFEPVATQIGAGHPR